MALASSLHLALTATQREERLREKKGGGHYLCVSSTGDEDQFQLQQKKRHRYTVIPFVSISAEHGICTVVMGLNGTLVEAKIRTFKCPKCIF